LAIGSVSCFCSWALVYGTCSSRLFQSALDGVGIASEADPFQ
jgi:hypothetical protein